MSAFRRVGSECKGGQVNTTREMLRQISIPKPRDALSTNSNQSAGGCTLCYRSDRSPEVEAGVSSQIATATAAEAAHVRGLVIYVV